MKPSRPRGIALVLVLWVLTLLTVMALGMTLTQRTETALLENQIGGARFRATADAAIAFTILSFLSPANEEGPGTNAADPEVSQPWIPNGAPRAWQFNGESVSIAVFNEASRINLNQADPQLLAALMQAVGVEDQDALRLADAIADWRDEDDLRLLNGAEDGDYEDAGRALGAKDAPFETVEELQQVLGMSPILYQRLAPELTVDSQGATPDPRFASPLVIAALEGIPLEEAEQRVQERDSPLFADSQGSRAVDRGGPLYRIQIRELTGGPGGRGLEALVELMPGQQPPYLVRWRRYGRPNAPPFSDVDLESAQDRR
ncbi:MAG: general secretion pathway protein GspK [Bdellovibrio bacteriovorus]